MLCNCMAKKVLLILVNLGIKIPYYPAVLLHRLKLSYDNVNWNSCLNAISSRAMYIRMDKRCARTTENWETARSLWEWYKRKAVQLQINSILTLASVYMKAIRNVKPVQYLFILGWFDYHYHCWTDMNGSQRSINRLGNHVNMNWVQTGLSFLFWACTFNKQRWSIPSWRITDKLDC